MKRLLLMVLFTLTYPVVSLANDPYDALLELSGVNIQLGQLPPGVITGLRDSGLFPDPVIAEIHQAAQGTRDNVLEDIKRSLQSGLAPDEIDELLSWYHRDVARKVTKAEIRGHLLGIPDDETQSRLLENTKRRKQVERIVRMMNSVELSQSYSYSVSMALLVATSAQINQPFNRQEFDQQWEWISAGQTEHLERTLVVLVLQSLAPLTEQEVETYYEFLQTPASLKFHAIVSAEYVASISRQIWDLMINIQATINTHGLSNPDKFANPPQRGATSP